MEQNYLQWLSSGTGTSWWHDSADPDELRQGLANGASGVTTNPVLAASTVEETPEKWSGVLSGMPAGIPKADKAEYLLKNVTVNAASIFEPLFRKTCGQSGFVCAQVDPSKAGDREGMSMQAKSFFGWAPNIAVKLPVTSAGLDVLEDCIAAGITVTATVSFTVSQSLEVSRRYLRGAERAEKAGIKPGSCFPVIMIGRIDDYLREVAADNGSQATEADIRQAGLAITRRAYNLFRKNNCSLKIIVAALRGTYHMSGLAGGEMIMSIHPKIQKMILSENMERDPGGIGKEIPPDVIKRLSSMPEFVKAYEPGGLTPDQFISYGVTQRTLSQFTTMGWGKLENYRSP